MGITIYSVVISIVFFNLALIVAFIMRRSSVMLAKQTTQFMLLTVLLGVARLLTPIDFDKAIVLRSYRAIPAIEDFLKRPVVGSFTIASLLLAIWLFGTLAFLIRDVTRQIHFVRTSRSYPPSDRRDLLELAGEYGSDFSLLVSPSISRPYTAGLFRPCIYLPDIELSEEQWKIILRHEVQHIRSHDEWKKLFFVAVQALFWWNPLAHISRSEIDTLIELQCDARVTAEMSGEEVDRYLDLLKTLKDRSAERALPVGASTLVWDQKQLVARFEALQNAGSSGKKKSRIIWYLLLFSAFVLSYFVVAQPIRFADDATIMDEMPSSELYHVSEYKGNTSEMYIKIQNGTYFLYVNDINVGIIDENNLSLPPFNTLPIQEDTP